MLELIGVSKSYGAEQAVRSCDLEIAARKTTVLIGPSGCGKSTLLRLMLGLVQPDCGAVRVLGEDLTPASADRLRRRLGYVIQSGGLFPHLTARQNLTLMPHYLKWGAGRIADRLDALVELTHFPTEALERYPVQLSGGQQQRVGLMRGLMLDPEVLLLDETLGALDPMVRSSLQRELRTIFSRLDKTVVLVTHDLREAAYFGDTIVLMRGGAVVQCGCFADLSGSPAESFVTEFISAHRGPAVLAEGSDT